MASHFQLNNDNDHDNNNDNGNRIFLFCHKNFKHVSFKSDNIIGNAIYSA